MNEYLKKVSGKCGLMKVTFQLEERWTVTLQNVYQMFTRCIEEIHVIVVLLWLHNHLTNNVSASYIFLSNGEKKASSIFQWFSIIIIIWNILHIFICSLFVMLCSDRPHCAYNLVIRYAIVVSWNYRPLIASVIAYYMAITRKESNLFFVINNHLNLSLHLCNIHNSVIKTIMWEVHFEDITRNLLIIYLFTA